MDIAKRHLKFDVISMFLVLFLCKMSSDNHECQTKHSVSSLHQTLDELDFERGIWYAAQCGDIEKIQKLLDQGTDVDKRDSAGYTALHYAARNGHLNVCKLLLKNQSHINAKTKSGCATALHRACSAGQTDVVKYLLANGADVQATDADGKTLLHRAAENKNPEIYRIILAACSELLHIADNRGKKPTDYMGTDIEC